MVREEKQQDVIKHTFPMKEKEMMKVESTTVLPPKNRGGQYQKYPWHEMKIGSSFLVEGYSFKLSTNLGTSGNNWCKRHNVIAKIATRKEGENLRVFMIENNKSN
jgi:hypothetical protein